MQLIGALVPRRLRSRTSSVATRVARCVLHDKGRSIAARAPLPPLEGANLVGAQGPRPPVATTTRPSTNLAPSVASRAVPAAEQVRLVRTAGVVGGSRVTTAGPSPGLARPNPAGPSAETAVLPTWPWRT